jgi:hypothetical protein
MALNGVKNNVGGGGNSVGGRGDRGPGTVSLKDLPAEQQHAHEILKSLADMNESQLRARIVIAAGAREPVGANGLKLVVELYASLLMPLSVLGVQRFKQERSLSGGTLGGVIAKAYARSLDGNEILVRVDRKEEQALTPPERDCLRFLRDLSRKTGADEVRAVKKGLRLGNPKMPAPASLLENEYVGVNTVVEIERATTLRSIPLTREGLAKLATELVRENGGKP